ncbi:MAG TPA: GWxTD domain-containing protein [Longimicrobiales bacterium]|nr:GWxTD domain-containing protein [Longimicrobiales bacterium]
MYALLALALAGQGPDTSQISLYRYWREPNVTAVVGFVRIPLKTLTFEDGPSGHERTASYRLTLAFRDAKGTVLHREEWSRGVAVPKGPIPAAADAVENLSVNLAPGSYRLEVTVVDSLGHDSIRAARELSAATARPVVGDLLLATEIRPLKAGETTPVGQLQRGTAVITPNLQDAVSTGQPDVSLYTEVYPASAADTTVAQVSLLLRSRDGRFERELPAGRRRYPRAGGVEMLHLPLVDVRPGDYTLALRVRFPDTTVTTERPLVVVGAPAVEVGSALFEGTSETQLDRVYEASKYLAQADELRTYRTLDAAGKRRLMERFWGRRDPTPATPNEAYASYMARVASADHEFGEGSRPGWATDRGRIYVTHGAPAERFTQPEVRSGGFNRPFEIWKFTEGRGDKYVFYDMSGMGVYHLVYTTDRSEASDPNWEHLFDNETLNLIRRF